MFNYAILLDISTKFQHNQSNLQLFFYFERAGENHWVFGLEKNELWKLISITKVIIYNLKIFLGQQKKNNRQHPNIGSGKRLKGFLMQILWQL